ncbi:MAG TPA: SH3 domain-containing protein [Candidatus Limiplasma pullicola]|nr:SH3 domain-containing protein [Candidatus Limiplasma pullicola]
MKRFLAVLLVAVMLLSVLPATSMAASYATVVGGWLRLRSAPNFSASTITSYYTGTQVQILSSSGGWYKVQTPDGRTGYMYGDYLRVGGSIPSEGTAYVTSYNGYGVRLRTGPGTGYRIIRTYAVGTPVTVLERGTYWSRISIGGTVGYMMSQFLHFGSDYPDDGNVLCYATIWSSNGYGVRLRTGPSKSYSKIGVYSVGTKVAVLQKGAVWDRIRVGSRVGWMMNEFLIYHENNEVSSVTLNNYMPVVGSVLSMQAVSPSTATVSYEWLVGGVLKSTNTTYTVDANDVGKTIQLRVTGTGSYKGTVTSAATDAVLSNTVLTGVTLNTIAPVVGDVMTATLNPAGASVIYAWKVGGYQVSNAATYTVTANDVGKQIELIVTGTGVYSGTQSSGLTAAVSASRAVADVVIRNDSNPTVGAAPSVGDTLTAVPSPAQATVTYQWNRDGAAISGATAASYTVAAEDEGHKLSVTVTGTGSYTGTDTSSETAVVVVKAPKLSIDGITFAEVVEGYEQPVAQALTIKNEGNATANITVASSDNDHFTLTQGNTQIAAGATDTTWTIQPKAGLAARDYLAKITVSYDGGRSTVGDVTFIVKESTPTPGSELKIDGVTFDTVQEGYDPVDPQNLTVTNTSDAEVNITSAVLTLDSDSGDFYLDGITASIDAHGTYNYTINPIEGLDAGTYTAVFQVTYGDNKIATANVSFTVTSADQTSQSEGSNTSSTTGDVIDGTSTANDTTSQTDPAQQTGADTTQQTGADDTTQQTGADTTQQTGADDTTQQTGADTTQQTGADTTQQTGADDTTQQTGADTTQQTGADTTQQTSADTTQQTDADTTQQISADTTQQTYSEPEQQPAAEPESQAPAATELTIQPATGSVTKGKTLQLTALINNEAIVYNSENDEAYPILWTLSGASKKTSISASGLLTVDADETATSLTVTATLKSDANHFSTVNLQVKEAQTTETTDTADTAVDTIINEDGTNDIMMESLEMIFNQ